MEKIPIYQSNQKIEDPGKIDFAAEALSLMDLSSQNDNQFSGNQTEPKTHEFSGVLGAEKEVNTLGIDVDYHMPELRESTDPEKARKKGRCDLRKSLAWDSAFFSNAGVLDPEEVSTMIKGVEKDKNHLLPGIEEDIRRSIDSISTLESDNFMVESLEDDLFVDIRASIQRSNKKVPNATNCISKSAAIEIDNQAISTLKKESIASQKKLLVKPALKNTSTQTIKMPKCQPKQNVGMQGSGKAVKQHSGHSQVTQTDKPSSLRPKPPKAISKPTLTSTSAAKRDSTGSSRVKSDIGSSKLSTVSSKGSQASKVPVLSGARRVLPKPVPSSKSSALGSSTSSKILSTRSFTLSDSSDSMLSKTIANSSLMTARRIPVKSSTFRSSSSDSIPKTPSKEALKNKPPPSSLSAYLRSTKISSSVSPASSISEWSSATSSSSSTVYQRSSNSRNSLDFSSCPSVYDSVVPLGLRSTDQIADEYKSKETALPANNSNKSSAQSGTLQAPAKPTGLRMPSPKIGFFDGAKSIRTPNGTPRTQSGLGNVLTKTGAAICSPKGSSNIKPKNGKFPKARAVSSLANVKPDSPKSRSPASFRERSCALINDSGALTGVKDSPSLSPEAQGNRSGENFLKSQKVQAKGQDGNKRVLDAGTGAIMNENLGELIDEAAFDMHTNICNENIKIVLVEDNNAMGSKSIGHRVDKDVLDDQNHKCLSSVLKTIEDQQELSGSKEYVNSNIYSQKGEPLFDKSDSVSVSFPETASTTTVSRAPLALKDSFYNSECPDFSKESTTQLVEKMVIASPNTDQKENI